MDRLVDLWVKNLEPWVTPYWDSVALWRTLSLLLFSVVVLAVVFRSRLAGLLRIEERRGHDLAAFRACDSILTEAELAEWLDTLERCDPHSQTYWTDALNFLRHFEETGHQYLSARIRRSCRQLLDALDALHKCVTDHCFPLHGTGNPRLFALYPELKYGTQQEQAKYERTLDELLHLSKATRTAYERYRREVKRVLQV